MSTTLLYRQQQHDQQQQQQSHFVSKETQDIVDLVFYCLGVFVVSVFGAFGNFINILVLYRHGFSSSTNILLFSLSITDCLFLCVMTVARVHCLVAPFDPPLASSINTVTTQVTIVFSRYLLSVSVSHAGLISVERFTAVFFPFYASKLITCSHVSAIIVCIYIFRLLFYIPSWAFTILQWVTDAQSNTTMAIMAQTAFYETHEKELNFYVLLVGNTSTNGLNVILVSICCLSIVVKLIPCPWTRDLLFTRRASRDKKDMRASKLLLTVCAIFLLTFAPSVYTDVYFYLTIPNNVYSDPRHVFTRKIFEFLYCCHASANFIVYVTLSTKYRATYVTLVGEFYSTCAWKPARLVSH